MKILLIEDDNDLMYLLQTLIRRTRKYDLIYSATSIEEGKERIININLDLIIMDWHIRQSNAQEIIDLAKAKDGSSTEFILISGIYNIAELAESNKITKYLMKPFNLRDFESLLAQSALLADALANSLPIENH